MTTDRSSPDSPPAVAEPHHPTLAQDHGDACGCGHEHHHHAPGMPYQRAAAKIGRNDVCPCGSGKKYKKCCLELERG